MTTTKIEVEQMEEALLPGDSDEQDGETTTAVNSQEDVVVVRVAINPSMLDRILRSDRYYFYDDISVPYQSLLVGAEHELLPSQKERLLLLADERGGTSESRMFGHLWMRLCARLSKAKADYIQSTKIRFGFLGLLWAVSTFFVGLLMIKSEDTASVLLLVPVVFGLYHIVKQFEEVTEAEVQEIVDVMEQAFSAEGFHVDLVTSHSVMHIRLKKAPAPTTTTTATTTSTKNSFASSSLLLKEAMEGFQLEALHNHQEALVSARQEKMKTSGPPETVMGIRFKTLLWWQPCLKTIVVIGGFMWVSSLIVGFTTGIWMMTTYAYN